MGGKKRNRRRPLPAHVDEPAGAGLEPGSSAATSEIGRRGKWTAAGAARAARTARIDTAAHLRRAEVAHRWEITKVVSAMDMWREHLRGQAGSHRGPVADAAINELARDVLLGGSGVSWPYPVGLGAAAQAVLDRRADDLDAATLYVVSPSMCDVVIAAAQTLTLDDLALLGPDDLPSPTGLIVLPFPLIVRTVGGGLSDDRAYLWHPAQVHHPEPVLRSGVLARMLRRARTATAPDGWLPTAEVRAAVRVTSFMDAHGPVRPDSFRDMAAAAAAAGTPLPPLLSDSTRTLPFQPTITDATRDAISAYTAVAREHGQQWRAINAELGIDEDDTVLDTATGTGGSFTYRSGDEIDDVDDLFAMRFLYAFSRLCSQQIAQLDDAGANHSARLQADRAGVSPEVRVVSIRPGRRTAAVGEPGGRDWQHRWVVRMHKVRQWYPSEQRHKILYRGPYVKGPADKPLLGGEVVRAMT